MAVTKLSFQATVKMASTTLSISKPQVLSLYRGLLKFAKSKVTKPGNKDALLKPYITKQFKDNKNLKEESKIFELYNNGKDAIRVFLAAEEQLSLLDRYGHLKKMDEREYLVKQAHHVGLEIPKFPEIPAATPKRK